MERLTTVARNNPYMNKRKERNVKKRRNPYVKRTERI
jgi:hypothetical protein